MKLCTQDEASQETHVYIGDWRPRLIDVAKDIFEDEECFGHADKITLAKSYTFYGDKLTIEEQWKAGKFDVPMFALASDVIKLQKL